MTAGSMAVTRQKGVTNTTFGAGFIVADPVASAATTLALPATAGTNYIIDSVDFNEVRGALLVGMAALDTNLPPHETAASDVILRYVYAGWPKNPEFDSSFAARNVLGDADDDYAKYFNYFSNHRNFALPSGLGRIIGKPLLFSMANSWAKFFQVDKLRILTEAEKKEF
jgi:hypothetical protein